MMFVTMQSYCGTEKFWEAAPGITPPSHCPGLKEAGLGIRKDLNGRYEFVGDARHDVIFG